MSTTPQQLISEFASIPAGHETATQRQGIVDQLAEYGIYQYCGHWWLSDSDLGPVSPEGSVRATSKQKKPRVYDADIERLMELAMQEPSDGSNIVGLGAMWLAAELYGLQEQQEQGQAEKHELPNLPDANKALEQ